MAYNLETILSEKIETVLSGSIANTRPRDYYDIYILYSIHNKNIDVSTLRDAVDRTSHKRGSTYIITEYQSILSYFQLFCNEFDTFISLRVLIISYPMVLRQA